MLLKVKTNSIPTLQKRKIYFQNIIKFLYQKIIIMVSAASCLFTTFSPKLPIRGHKDDYAMHILHDLLRELVSEVNSFKKTGDSLCRLGYAFLNKDKVKDPPVFYLCILLRFNPIASKCQYMRVGTHGLYITCKDTLTIGFICSTLVAHVSTI